MKRRLSLRSAIRRIGLKKSDAASLLGVNRGTLWRWEKKLQAPRGLHAQAVREVIKYAGRLKKSAVNIEHRKNVLKKILSDVFPPPPPPPLPPPPPVKRMNYIDLHEYIEQIKSSVKQLVVNGVVVNDTPLGWIDDHRWAREQKGVIDGDDSKYWRITLDYSVSFGDGALRIDFDPSIL